MPLSELGLKDIPVAGGKAARLGHLAKLGFDVPDGFVLLSSAWGDHAAARTAVDEGLATLGDEPVAVRSSGIVEDLSGASFAGQYASVLGVSGRAAVMTAVDRCWESAREARVRSYANERAGGQDGPMAVLIQRMVAAEAAGVAYSSNPLTGNSNEVVISAVRGLGERLVAGEAAPDEWIVRNGAANCASPVEGSIAPEMALEIARLASRVADAMGSPQDVEWAVAGGKLHLLQARPMVGTPEWVAWDSPVERGFARHFRLVFLRPPSDAQGPARRDSLSPACYSEAADAPTARRDDDPTDRPSRRRCCCSRMAADRFATPPASGGHGRVASRFNRCAAADEVDRRSRTRDRGIFHVCDAGRRVCREG